MATAPMLFMCNQGAGPFDNLELEWPCHRKLPLAEPARTFFYRLTGCGPCRDTSLRVWISPTYRLHMPFGHTGSGLGPRLGKIAHGGVAPKHGKHPRSASLRSRSFPKLGPRSPCWLR